MSGLNGTLRITFASDWQCGSGLGRHGSIDRVIVRDPDGLPFVPGKTVLGIWRDACEKAALGLDDGEPRAWSHLVGVLFGAGAGTGRDPDEASGCLVVRPARLADDWRVALGPAGTADAVQQVLRAGLTLPRYGVAIDDETGVARDDTLRLMERASAGLTLSTGYSAELSGDTWAAELLLAAGASLVHHVGSSRRRGAGRCTVSLDPGNLAELVGRHVDDIATFRVGQVQRVRTGRRTSPIALPRAGELALAARLRLRTLQPVIAGAGVQGNVLLSHDFVPGATLLPIIAGAVGARASGLIRHGHMVVTDATPVIGERRATRTPLTVQSEGKGDQWKVDHKAVNVLLGRRSGTKPIGRWAVMDGSSLTIRETSVVSRAHASIDDEAQRPLEDGVFTLEAIPAGTELEAEVWVSDEVSRDELEALERLGKRAVTLGRYRRADYGEVSVAVIAPSPVDTADQVLADFVLVLTSDCHLLDRHGRPAPTAARLTEELARRLEVEVHLLDSVVAVTRRDSWSATHALPRTTLSCLAAGSCLRLAVDGGVSRSRLDAVLSGGLGARSVEGFGRATILDLPGEVSAMPFRSVAAIALAAPTPEPADAEWESLRSEAWRREITRQLRAAASKTEVRAGVVGGATNSQRGTLRRAAALLLTDREAVARWLSATRQDEGKTKAWGSGRLSAIEGWAKPADDLSWRRRLAGLIGELSGRDARVPDDLGGASPAGVAAIFLTECLSQEALSRKGSH